jgi:nucleotide-binding universal stress UspA family protein
MFAALSLDAGSILVYGLLNNTLLPPSLMDGRRNSGCATVPGAVGRVGRVGRGAERAEETAEQTLACALSDAGGAAWSVPLEVRTVAGDPAAVLLDEAADADLLVVGHRGRGAIASACLGSVGLHCVVHAPRPVVVVRPSGSPAAQNGEVVGAEVAEPRG